MNAEQLFAPCNYSGHSGMVRYDWLHVRTTVMTIKIRVGALTLLHGHLMNERVFGLLMICVADDGLKRTDTLQAFPLPHC